MKFSLLSLSWLGRSFHGPFCKKSTKKAGLGDFKDFKLWDSTFFQFRQAWSDFFREWLTKRKFRLQFKHNETEGWTRCQLSRVISYRMFSMFFFPLFPEDWRQAVSDESSVGRKSNPIAVQSSSFFLLVRVYFFLYSKGLALSLEIKQAYDCIMLFKVGKTGMVCWPQMLLYAACVASVSNRVIARKLEREQKDKKVEGGEGGEKRKRLPANPTILENAPWYFTVRFICKLTARQNTVKPVLSGHPRGML